MKLLKYSNFQDVIIGVVIFGISFPFLLNMERFVLGGAQDVVSPLFFPRFVVILVVILSFVLIVVELFKIRRIINGNQTEQSEEIDNLISVKKEGENIVSIGLYLVALFIYIALLHYVGFMVATPIVMVIVARIFNCKNYLKFILGSVGFSVGFYYLSAHVMKIMLPFGVFFE